MEAGKFDAASLAERDFGLFFRVILRQEMAGMHERIIDSAMSESRNIVIMAHRGSGKTNLLSKAFPLWVCFRTPASDPQVIVIQSASLEQSTEILRGVKRWVTTNPLLRERLLPDNIHESKWSETQLEFKNGHRIICRPFGDTIRGLHVNLSICDDVLKDETTNVEEAKKTFYSVVFPITQAKRGKHIVIGTPMSEVDLLYDLSRKKTFAPLYFPAFREDGTPQFPELFSKEKLDAIRETMPRHLWSREYLLKPVSEENALFPYETLIKPAVDLKYPPTTPDLEAQAVYVLGGDVAVSDKEKGDFACYTVLKKVPDRPWQYFKKHYFKGVGTGEQGEFVANLTKDFNFSKIVVEQTGLSYGVVDFLMKDNRTQFLTEGFNTSRKSKEEILGLLETWLRRGFLKLQNDASLLDELAGWEIIVKEGKQVPRSVKEHDDQVMSLALAVYAASQLQSLAGVIGVKTSEVPAERVPVKDLVIAEVFASRERDVFLSLNGDLRTEEEATYIG